MIKDIKAKFGSKFVKIILSIIVILLVIGQLNGIMVSQNNPNIVTSDNFEPITKIQVMKKANVVKNKLQHKNPELLSQISQSQIFQLAVYELIRERIVESIIEQYKLDISDEKMLELIKEDKYLQDSEHNFNKELFANIARFQDLTEDELFLVMKQDILKQIFFNAFSSNIKAPEFLTSQALKYYNEMRQADLMTFDAKNLKKFNIAAPSEEELKHFFEVNQEEFAISEKYDFNFVTIDLKKIRNTIKISDAELKKIYDDSLESFSIPDSYDFYDLVFADAEEATKLSKKLSHDIQKFDSIIFEYTKKPSSNFKIIEAESNNIDDEILNILSQLKNDEVSAPVKINNGYHIIKKIKHTPSKTLSFQSIKEELRKEYVEDKAKTILFDLIKDLEDDISAGATLAEVTEKNKMIMHKHNQESVESIKKIHPFKNSVTILEELLSLEQGDISEPIELSNDEYIVFEMGSKTTKLYPELSQVKSAVISRWKQQQNYNKNKEWLLKQLQNTKNLRNFANVNKIPVRTITILRPELEDNAKLPNELTLEVFSSKLNDFTQPVELGGKILIAHVTKIYTNTNSKIRRENLEANITHDIKQIFEQAILSYFESKGNLKINYKDPLFQEDEN